MIVAQLEAQALLSAGDLPAATRQLQAMHQQAEARAAADPNDHSDADTPSLAIQVVSDLEQAGEEAAEQAACCRPASLLALTHAPGPSQ